jgi:hypothetical protein
MRIGPTLKAGAVSQNRERMMTKPVYVVSTIAGMGPDA